MGETDLGNPRDRLDARIGIVGTGFAGLGAAIGLKRAGIDDFVVFERAADVGGTWRDNTYPGCQCDVPSHLYSFSFRPNPEWSRTYSTQPEIHRYLQRCAAESDVLPHVRFEHDVTNTSWLESEARWRVETSRGTWHVDYLILGHGGLATPSIPEIPGLESFTGRIVHSAAWDEGLDLDNQRVAVIGTGASAIQIVPRIQPKVARLHVFQRTPAWVLPHSDRPISDRERALYRRVPLAQKIVRAAIYAARELLVVGMAKRPRALKPLRAVAVKHLRSSVKDRELRRKLTPRYSPGCKRLLLSNEFYPALAAWNSELVTDAIREVKPSSIVTADGTEREIDCLVFATGFRVTDNPALSRVHGIGERSLRDAWHEAGMSAYLGTTVPGYPNLFLMTGPNTGIGHTSLVVMIEAQIKYIVDCIRYMGKHDLDTVEVKAEVADAFNEEVQTKMRRTVWTMGGCVSWYLDDKGRNSTLWPDFTWRFMRATRRFEPRDYVLARASSREREAVPA
jgi:cation diffusion facilitator CzcD-associated flavoprotein CzcO